MSVEIFLAVASGLTATTYYHGEMNCGDYTTPAVKCKTDAKTASGELLHPDIPSVAVAIPKIYRLKAQDIYIRTEKSACTKVRLNDKMAERFVGSRSFDITPKALELLGEVPHKNWSGRVFVCKGEKL